MTTSIISLGTCKCPRCCCCPPTVYYPPTLNLVWNYITGSTSFTISCSWLDCPRDHPRCSATGQCCTECHLDEDTEEYVCTDEVPTTSRCHGCTYALLGADGTPGIKPTLVETIPSGDPTVQDTQLIHLPPDTPYTSFTDGDGHECRQYITGFVFGCSGGINCPEGSDVCAGPGIFTYIDPNTGTPYGWQASANGHTICNGGINGWDDPTYSNCGFLSCTDAFCSCVDTTVWSTVFNQGLYLPDDPADGFPPLKIENPLDPWKFSCCPLKVRFLLGGFFPFTYRDGEGCHETYWPDPSEWPPHPDEYIPWNFAILPLCCCFDYFGTGPTPGQCDPNFDCQAAPPDTPFGFVDITGGAECFLPTDHDTNCLNALLPDGDSNAC